MKRASETQNFPTGRGAGSWEELSERCDGAAAATYRQLRPLYEEYRQSRDKEKFLRGHEGEIILFEAAARQLKRLDAVPLPATQRLRAEMDELTARKSALQSEYRKAQHKEREYDTLSQNVSMLLEQPKDIVLPKEKTNELE